MIAADAEHAPAGEQVEVAVALAVEEILPLPRAEADVVADRLQHPHHLLVHVRGVQRVALRLALGENGPDVEGAGGVDESFGHQMLR